MKPVLSILAAATLGLAGCASDLNFSNAAGKAVEGAPVRTMQTYAVTGNFTKSEKGKCEFTPFSLYENLPTGPLYYANVNAAPLGKTEFTLDIKADGTLSKVTLNSEPSSEAIKAITDAIPVIGGLVGLAPQKEASREAPLVVARVDGTAAPLPLCDAGPVVTSRTPLK